MLQPGIVSEKHYETIQKVKQTLHPYKELRDIKIILRLDELSEKYCLNCSKSTKN